MGRFRAKPTKGVDLARPNHQYEKRQRELAKKKKKEEKRRKKQERNESTTDETAPESDVSSEDGATGNPEG
jgi:hypothetical protein